jgi:hypothetical protein
LVSGLRFFLCFFSAFYSRRLLRRGFLVYPFCTFPHITHNYLVLCRTFVGGIRIREVQPIIFYAAGLTFLANPKKNDIIMR